MFGFSGVDDEVVAQGCLDKGVKEENKAREEVKGLRVPGLIRVAKRAPAHRLFMTGCMLD
jgi:hypothetical protein